MRKKIAFNPESSLLFFTKRSSSNLGLNQIPSRAPLEVKSSLSSEVVPFEACDNDLFPSVGSASSTLAVYGGSVTDEIVPFEACHDDRFPSGGSKLLILAADKDRKFFDSSVFLPKKSEKSTTEFIRRYTRFFHGDAIGNLGDPESTAALFQGHQDISQGNAIDPILNREHLTDTQKKAKELLTSEFKDFFSGKTPEEKETMIQSFLIDFQKILSRSEADDDEWKGCKKNFIFFVMIAFNTALPGQKRSLFHDLIHQALNSSNKDLINLAQDIVEEMTNQLIQADPSDFPTRDFMTKVSAVCTTALPSNKDIPLEKKAEFEQLRQSTLERLEFAIRRIDKSKNTDPNWDKNERIVNAVKDTQLFPDEQRLKLYDDLLSKLDTVGSTIDFEELKKSLALKVNLTLLTSKTGYSKPVWAPWFLIKKAFGAIKSSFSKTAPIEPDTETQRKELIAKIQKVQNIADLQATLTRMKTDLSQKVDTTRAERIKTINEIYTASPLTSDLPIIKEAADNTLKKVVFLRPGEQSVFWFNIQSVFKKILCLQTDIEEHVEKLTGKLEEIWLNRSLNIEERATLSKTVLFGTDINGAKQMIYSLLNDKRSLIRGYEGQKLFASLLTDFMLKHGRSIVSAEKGVRHFFKMIFDFDLKEHQGKILEDIKTLLPLRTDKSIAGTYLTILGKCLADSLESNSIEDMSGQKHHTQALKRKFKESIDLGFEKAFSDQNKQSDNDPYAWINMDESLDLSLTTYKAFIREAVRGGFKPSQDITWIYKELTRPIKLEDLPKTLASKDEEALNKYKQFRSKLLYTLMHKEGGAFVAKPDRFSHTSRRLNQIRADRFNGTIEENYYLNYLDLSKNQGKLTEEEKQECLSSFVQQCRIGLVGAKKDSEANNARKMINSFMEHYGHKVSELLSSSKLSQADRDFLFDMFTSTESRVEHDRQHLQIKGLGQTVGTSAMALTATAIMPPTLPVMSKLFKGQFQGQPPVMAEIEGRGKVVQDAMLHSVIKLTKDKAETAENATQKDSTHGQESNQESSAKFFMQMQSTLLSAFRSDPFNYEKWFNHLPENSTISDNQLHQDVSQEFLKKAGLEPEHFRETGFKNSLSGLAYSEVASIAKRTGLDTQDPLFIDQASVASSLYNLIGKTVNGQVLDAACVLNAIHLAQNDPAGKSSFPRSLLPANTLTKVILFAKAEKDSLFKDSSKSLDDANSVAENPDENDEKITLSEFLVSKTPDFKTASLGLIPAILESENNTQLFLSPKELEDEKKYIQSELMAIGHKTLWNSSTSTLNRSIKTDLMASFSDDLLADPSTLSEANVKKLLKAFPDISKLSEEQVNGENQKMVVRLAKLYTGTDSLAEIFSTHLSTQEKTTLFLEYAKKLEIQDYLLTQALKTTSNIAIKDLTFSAGRNVKGVGLKDYLYLLKHLFEIKKLEKEKEELEEEVKALEESLKITSDETEKRELSQEIMSKVLPISQKNEEIEALSIPLKRHYPTSLINYFKKHLEEESSLKRAKEAMAQFWNGLGQHNASDASAIGPQPRNPQQLIQDLLERLSMQERVR